MKNHLVVEVLKRKYKTKKQNKKKSTVRGLDRREEEFSPTKVILVTSKKTFVSSLENAIIYQIKKNFFFPIKNLDVFGKKDEN